MCTVCDLSFPCYILCPDFVITCPQLRILKIKEKLVSLWYLRHCVSVHVPLFHTVIVIILIWVEGSKTICGYNTHARQPEVGWVVRETSPQEIMQKLLLKCYNEMLFNMFELFMCECYRARESGKNMKSKSGKCVLMCVLAPRMYHH